jgi:hypothetical protein
MVKQIGKVRIERVNTMLDELDLEAFLINGPIGAHNPDCSLDLSLEENMARGGERGYR